MKSPLKSSNRSPSSVRLASSTASREKSPHQSASRMTGSQALLPPMARPAPTKKHSKTLAFCIFVITFKNIMKVEYIWMQMWRRSKLKRSASFISFQIIIWSTQNLRILSIQADLQSCFLTNGQLLVNPTERSSWKNRPSPTF